MSSADFVRYGFTAHREAIEDLDRLPRPVRRDALLLLHEVMQGRIGGLPLDARPDRDLSDCRKLYVDSHNDWRLVYRETSHAWNSPVQRDIVLVAAGRRTDLAVYDIAARRLGRDRGPSATTAAARSRSTLMSPTPHGPTPGAPATATTARSTIVPRR